jgi:hypothetical protein
MIRTAIPLTIAHLIGNALILWLGYCWLGIAESDGAHLVWSAIVLLVFVLAALWLHGTAFAVFDNNCEPHLGAAAKKVGSNLIPLFVVALCAMILYWALAQIYDKFIHSALVIASFLTLHLRKPVSPGRVLACYHGLIWILRWVALPALLLPLAASLARDCWRGYRLSSLRRSRNVLYWIGVCALLLLAIWLPLKLVHWIPKLPAFNAQMASFLARVALGYLLFVVALLSLEFFTSAGKPCEIQPSTLVSP